MTPLSIRPFFQGPRLWILLVGILLPYLARLPGSLVYGFQWLTSYLEGGVAGFLSCVTLSAGEGCCW